jgi:hypothetical protein
MKKCLMMFFCCFLFLAFSFVHANAQCSICTKTASQLGEKPAKGLNSGILYLMVTPLAIGGFIGFRWWKREKEFNSNN